MGNVDMIQNNVLYEYFKDALRDVGPPIVQLILFLLVISFGFFLLLKSVDVIFGALGNAWRELVEQIKSSISR